MKISVVIPVYNQEKLISHAIDSVLMQKKCDFECIVIDGGSTDGTVQKLKKYNKKIKWISEKDSGISNAVNKGLKMSTGDVVTFIGSDDCYSSILSLFKIKNFFIKNKKARCVNASYTIVNSEGVKIQSFVISYKNFLRGLPFQKWILGITNFIIQPSMFWKRELMNEIGYFKEDLKYCMDYHYWIRITRKNRIYIINDHLVNYKIHSGSNRGSSYRKLFKEDYRVVRTYFKNIFILFLHYIHNIMTVFIYDRIS